jgi:hypothetical protein
MKTPTIQDLQDLMPEAAKEHEREPPMLEEPGPMAGDAMSVLKTLLALIASPMGVKWHEVRVLALRAMHLCALIAWEAGKRHIRPGDFVGRGSDGIMRRVEYSPTPTGSPPQDGDAGTLLREADTWRFGLSARNGRTYNDMIHDLAAALRAERERASMAVDEAVWCRDHKRDAERLVDEARGHLRAVLDFMWPSEGGPTVVQKARAFPAGEEQAPRPEDVSGPNQARYAIRCERKRANDAEKFATQLRAQLAAEAEAHAHTSAELADAKGGPAAAGREVERLQGVAREALAAQNRAESEAADLRGALDIERKAHEVTGRVASALRTELEEAGQIVEKLTMWAKKGRA